MELSKEQVVDTFMNTQLEGDYNFLQEDLLKLANAFVAAAAPEIAKEERVLCLAVARSVNHLVAERIAQIRSQ
jgi:hypothetical protein